MITCVLHFLSELFRALFLSARSPCKRFGVIAHLSLDEGLSPREAPKQAPFLPRIYARRGVYPRSSRVAIESQRIVSKVHFSRFFPHPSPIVYKALDHDVTLVIPIRGRRLSF